MPRSMHLEVLVCGMVNADTFKSVQGLVTVQMN